jgi:hypothetical protein
MDRETLKLGFFGVVRVRGKAKKQMTEIVSCAMNP